ncbi:hypothetical protein E2320_014404 [Naja naja]|nr:hypothetical protein E2320_014404 [Naja naja]
MRLKIFPSVTSSASVSGASELSFQTLPLLKGAGAPPFEVVLGSYTGRGWKLFGRGEQETGLKNCPKKAHGAEDWGGEKKSLEYPGQVWLEALGEPRSMGAGILIGTPSPDPPPPKGRRREKHGCYFPCSPESSWRSSPFSHISCHFGGQTGPTRIQGSLQSIKRTAGPVEHLPAFFHSPLVRDTDAQSLPVQADHRETFSNKGALAGREGDKSSPGTEPPLPPWREGRDALPAGNARAGSPRGKPGKPKSGIRCSSLPPGGGKISWEEGRQNGGRRESSPTCPERDPKASREGPSADPPWKNRESRREVEIGGSWFCAFSRAPVPPCSPASPSSPSAPPL